MSESSAKDAAPTGEPTFKGWMGSMWLYTLLRFGMFGVLWAIFYFLGVSTYLGALIALVISVPLSLVLLAGPRRRFTDQLEMRVNARKAENHDLATQLDPNAEREAHFQPDDRD
jgi:hypothetical protein